MDKCREAFEKLPEINAILRGSKFGFNESINQYYHPNHTEHRLNYAFLMGAWIAWQARQAEMDRLNSVLDERTKEWLEAIELGKYFENVAKPLKAELDEKDKRIDTLITQIEMSDFKDSLGHELKSNLAYLDLKALRGES